MECIRFIWQEKGNCNQQKKWKIKKRTSKTILKRFLSPHDLFIYNSTTCFGLPFTQHPCTVFVLHHEYQYITTGGTGNAKYILSCVNGETSGDQEFQYTRKKDEISRDFRRNLSKNTTLEIES